MSDRVFRLLVVDDNRMQRIKLSRALEGRGYSVAVAEGGEAALGMLRAEPFDLVLLDIVMPGMDGYQVLAAIQQDSGIRNVPVIMVSTFDDDASVARCLDMGAADHLPKSFDLDTLTNRVKKCLERSRALGGSQ